MEIEKRRKFTDSRRKNLHMGVHMGKHMDGHMVNANENANENANKDANGVKNENALIIGSIVADLNVVCKTSYRENTPETRKMINTLLERGFTIQDFIIVHRKKFEEWGLDPEWSRFLRPATLYQPKKFEGYLNQSNKRPPANSRNIKTSQNWLEKREGVKNESR